MASQEAAAFTQLQAELVAGCSATETTYHPSSAAKVIARNRAEATRYAHQHGLIAPAGAADAAR